MNRGPFTFIRRTIFASVALASLALAANAGPLPPPSPAEVSAPLLILAPADGGVVEKWDMLSWDDIGASKYIVKMKIVATGQSVKKTVKAGICEKGECSLSLHATGLLDVVRDGQQVKWSVVAKSVEGKTKSETRTLVADTVVQEALVTPESNQHVAASTSLQWTNYHGAKKFKLIVRNGENGKIVLEKTVKSANCSDICSVSSNEVLKPGKQYNWFVQSIASNGDKAKSQTWSFWTHSVDSQS